MSINIPESFIGKNIEILAFVIDDLENEDDVNHSSSSGISLASEQVLSKEWLSKEEDEVWKNL